MAFIVLGACVVISLALGFAIKSKIPELHLIMCLLISFAIALLIAAVATKMLGGFGS